MGTFLLFAFVLYHLMLQLLKLNQSQVRTSAKMCVANSFSRLGLQEHHLLWIVNKAAGCGASCLRLALNLDNRKPWWGDNSTFPLGLVPPRIISNTTGDFSPWAAKRGWVGMQWPKYFIHSTWEFCFQNRCWKISFLEVSVEDVGISIYCTSIGPGGMETELSPWT